MGLFGKNKKDGSNDKPKQSAQVVQTGSVSSNPFYTFSNYTPMNVDNRIYAQLREGDRKSTRLNSSHKSRSRMPSSA